MARGDEGGEHHLYTWTTSQPRSCGASTPMFSLPGAGSPRPLPSGPASLCCPGKMPGPLSQVLPSAATGHPRGSRQLARSGISLCCLVVVCAMDTETHLCCRTAMDPVLTLSSSMVQGSHHGLRCWHWLLETGSSSSPSCLYLQSHLPSQGPNCSASLSPPSASHTLYIVVAPAAG